MGLFLFKTKKPNTKEMKERYILLQRYPNLSKEIKEGDQVEKLESSTMRCYMHKSGAIIPIKEVESEPNF